MLEDLTFYFALDIFFWLLIGFHCVTDALFELLEVVFPVNDLPVTLLVDKRLELLNALFEALLVVVD